MSAALDISQHRIASRAIPATQSAPSAGGALVALRWLFTRYGILKLAGFFLLVAILAQSLDLAINAGLRSVRTSEFGAFNRCMAGQVNAEILINGSSRALAHYDPRVIQQVTGATAFNLGRNASQTDMQVALLKAYLHHNSKPRVVVQNLDPSTFVVTHKGEIYDPGFYMPYLSEGVLYNALLRITPDARKWKYIPLYGYAVEDLRFSWITGIKSLFGVDPQEDFFLGFNPRHASWTGDFSRFKADNPNGIGSTIEAAGIQALEQIISTCQEENVQVILVYSPEYCEMQALERDRAKIMALFHEIAQRRGIPFWDYSDSAICQQRDWFYNSQHLNDSGAQIFSADLGKRLKQLDLGGLARNSSR